ncbi:MULTISPECIES: hypothetical protein [Streptosporangium]|uniref:Tetratricopeptide (TPR) repeat protein n=1 Tax=Streptosporangium brasiliense TaxID=47480 RepID=A0ABT9R9X8_9ACTN|nr:hypothetical protein [Streptosporangium brasiliense]MDP9865958.1 tetratricopeptide (TPR) repeat protein [Streptosporangium brasiliense]
MVAIDIPTWAARMRAWRRGRLWSRQDLSRQLTDVADDTARDRLPSQERLTEMIRAWEAGEQRPDELYSELFCRAFGMNEAELFSGEAAGTTLWHHLTGIPLMAGTFSAEDEERTGRAIEDPRRTDEQTAAYFRTVLRAYSRPDLRPARTINALSPVFATIDALHREARSDIRQSLLLLSSQDAELISRMHYEGGNLAEALAWSDRALLAAHQAGDERLVAYTLARRAGLQDTRGNPEQVIDLAVAAREHVLSPPPLEAMARRHEAQGHAMAGAEDMCHRRLEESAEAPQESPKDDVPITFDYPAWVHNALAAGCLIQLHHPADAIEILERDLSEAPSNYLTAYNMACLAHAYADAHEGERSAGVARQALTMSRQTGAGRALEELRLIRDDLYRWSHPHRTHTRARVGVGG